MLGEVEHNGVVIKTLEDESDDGTITVTFDEEFRCKVCRQIFKEKSDADAPCPKAKKPGAAHELGHYPLAWLNHASITLDAEGESVTVSISVTDPRGALSMEIRRHDDGSIIMFVPYEGMSMAHAPIRQLHPGSFAIGEQPQS